MTSYLVMLQTNSNQPFIFASPRLREQIGASFEITLLSRWVEEEAKCLLKAEDLPNTFWVSDSSGKVIVRFAGYDDAPESHARALIREVTLRALTDAPGLDVMGVFIATGTGEVQPKDLERLDREFSAYSLNRRPALARFPQFPFLERGSESALPASASLGALKFSQESLQPNIFDEHSPLSLPSRVKRAFASTSRKQQVDDVQERLVKQGMELKQEPQLDPTKLAAAFQDGEESEDAKNMLSSVGVVHIDGNGVGAIMRDLGSAHSEAQEAGVRVSADEVHTEPNDALQAFIMVVNKRLDKTVKDAIALSWYDVQELTPDTVVPIVPVLVGGDDVTVYTDGRYAIPFAEAYIRHYEELTEKDELLKQLAVVAGAKKPGPLTASAGVAIVGRNFPFHIAYDLAEGLVSRGKKLGKKKDTAPCSTIDFHVLRDATVLDPDETLDEYEGRTQRPFLIGHYAPERIGTATTASASDGEPQAQDQWKRILQAVAAFNGRDPDSPDKTLGDPFPRARANRIVKLLTDYVKFPKDDKAAQAACHGYVLKEDEKVSATQEQIDKDREESNNDKRITKRCNHPICAIRLEWTDAQENARGTKALVKALGPLPSNTRLVDPGEDTEDCIEQVRWLLDLIDLSENLPDGYIACRIARDANGRIACDEASGATTAGGAK
nr:hypothetical protein [Schaalia odontolytica]